MDTRFDLENPFMKMRGFFIKRDGDLFCKNLMSAVMGNVFYRPVNPSFKIMLAHHAILLRAYTAGKFFASVRMDEELHCFAEFISDKLRQCFYLYMRFIYIEIPWYRKMAIAMKGAAVFYYPQVMNVDPIFPAVFIQQANKVIK